MKQACQEARASWLHKTQRGEGVNEGVLAQAARVMAKYDDDVREKFIAYLGSQTQVEGEQMWGEFLKTVHGTRHAVKTEDVICLLNIAGTGREQKVRLISGFMNARKGR